METIIKGSKQKATFKVESGLPTGIYLTNEGVDVQLELFAVGKRPVVDEDKVIITKEQMHFDGEDSNEAIILFDTEKIDVKAKMLGEVTIKYTDPDVEEEVTQKILVTMTNEDGKVTEYKVDEYN